MNIKNNGYSTYSLLLLIATTLYTTNTLAAHVGTIDTPEIRRLNAQVTALLYANQQEIDEIDTTLRHHQQLLQAQLTASHVTRQPQPAPSTAPTQQFLTYEQQLYIFWERREHGMTFQQILYKTRNLSKLRNYTTLVENAPAECCLCLAPFNVFSTDDDTSCLDFCKKIALYCITAFIPDILYQSKSIPKQPRRLDRKFFNCDHNNYMHDLCLQAAIDNSATNTIYAHATCPLCRASRYIEYSN